MGAAVIALEAHNDEILEVRNACLTHFHLPRELARMTRDVKGDRFLLHEVIFLKGLGKVDFGTNSFGFDLFDLLFGVLLIVTHGN
jgi:hypothetical protein